MRSLAAIAMITLALVLAGGGSLLVRIDQLRAWDRAHAAQLRLAEARLELVRAELLGRHVLDMDGDGDLDVVAPGNARGVVWYENRLRTLERRTTALRGAILALVRTGHVAMPGDPGGDWALWPVELERSPRITEAHP